MLPNRRVILGLHLLALPLICCPTASVAKENAGVNQFTAPPIADLLQKADALQPIPFEKVWRDPPARTSTDRTRLALRAGSTIADGFLVIACEKRARVEVVGRSLLRSAKALGFGDQVSARSRHIVDEAEKDHWTLARRELLGAQAQAETALKTLHDEDLVQLVALGGWLRGLEITSGAIADRYSAERSRLLVRPELATYFLEKIGGMNAKVRTSPLVQKLQRTLQVVRDLVDQEKGQAISEAEVKRLMVLSRSANNLIDLEE